ncbi:hypothetical protein H1C71_015207 [Ictidomys tridecemlineatus]|nr:hypothetical protein H1C71_015207 [Ictidomys tridecemlineatus]
MGLLDPEVRLVESPRPSPQTPRTPDQKQLASLFSFLNIAHVDSEAQVQLQGRGWRRHHGSGGRWWQTTALGDVGVPLVCLVCFLWYLKRSCSWWIRFTYDESFTDNTFFSTKCCL